MQLAQFWLDSGKYVYHRSSRIRNQNSSDIDLSKMTHSFHKANKMYCMTLFVHKTHPPEFSKSVVQTIHELKTC